MKLKIHTDHKGIHVEGAENIGSTSDTDASTLKQFLRIAECWYLTYTRAFKEDLKPCPFCGSEASVHSGTEDHYVLCRNDDCVAALVARSFSSREEAIAAWNKRAK